MTSSRVSIGRCLPRGDLARVRRLRESVIYHAPRVRTDRIGSDSGGLVRVGDVTGKIALTAEERRNSFTTYTTWEGGVLMSCMAVVV